MPDDPRGPNQDTGTIRVIRDLDTPPRDRWYVLRAAMVVLMAPVQWPMFALVAFLVAAFWLGYGTGHVRTRPAEAAAYGPLAMATQAAALAGTAESPAVSVTGVAMDPPNEAPTPQPVTIGANGSTIPWMPETVTRWLPTIRQECTGATDEELAQIIMLVESGGYPGWVNSSNAHGLMQIVPRWHPECPQDTATLLDPTTNIRCGCRFLDTLLARYDAGTAAMKYNSGNVITAEGQRYFAWVTGMAAERHSATSATFKRWMAAGGAALVEKAAQ